MYLLVGSREQEGLMKLNFKEMKLRFVFDCLKTRVT